MTILDTIVEHKRMEVMKRKARKPVELLEKKPLYNRTPLDPLEAASKTHPNIIAEFKRRSPSKGKLSDALNPVPVVEGYIRGGAMASSILTDRDFFGGSFKDLENVKTRFMDFPLLRKDFIIDPYQLHEAKAYGADMILLIAAILDKSRVSKLAEEARALGLHVLLEVHTAEELDTWNPDISMVGVNNRDLRDFSVDIERSLEILPHMPAETMKISESGLHNPADVLRLHKEGFSGFLMGEYFMTAPEPAVAIENFITALKDH